METLISVLYIAAGFLLRLAIPILGTLLLVFLLRRLDARWQAEAERSPHEPEGCGSCRECERRSP